MRGASKREARWLLPACAALWSTACLGGDRGVGDGLFDGSVDAQSDGGSARGVDASTARDAGSTRDAGTDERDAAAAGASGAVCANSLDCPTTEVCDTAAGVCVACLADADCDGERVCVASRCEMSCDSDRDCTPMGQLCDHDAGRCVDCFTHAECPVTEHCREGSCRADVCTPGETTCDGDRVTTCTAVGDMVTVLATCSATQACVASGGSAGCVNQQCAPGERFCEGDVVAECGSDGLSRTTGTDCSATGDVCVDGACLTPLCTPSAVRCDGSQVKTCAADGLSEAVTDTCTATEYCDGTASTPACASQLCTPNAVVCVGNAVRTCDAVGAGYLAGGSDCGADVCVGGACQTPVCTPSAVFCSGGNVYQCSTNGLQQTLLDTCTAAEYCSPGVSQCQAVACTPGSSVCQGALLRTCNASGSGFEPSFTDCSASGRSCIDDACVACTPSNGGIEICDGRDNDCNGTPDEGAAVCPSGCVGETYQGHAYMFCANGRGWEAAEGVCRSAGMHLARIDDSAEDAWLDATRVAHSLGPVWLGGSDRGVEGDWRWIGGDAFWSGDYTGSSTGLYTNWDAATSQPDGGSPDCLVAPDASGWVDGKCSTSRAHVCEDYAAPVGCYDVVQNGSETDVDCGGSCVACPSCDPAGCPSCGLLEQPCCRSADECGCSLLGNILCQ